MQIKTVTTTDGVNVIDFGDTPDKFYWIKNVGTTTVYASTNADVAAGADGTAEITAGGSAMLENYDSIIYISGAGKVEIHETNNDVCPFKQAATDYSGDISDIYTLIPVAASAGNQLTDKAYVDSGLAEKVDKADGMGLSSNDYTTTEKNKLATLENYTLPTASADVLGGVKIGEGLTITDGVLSASGSGSYGMQTFVLENIDITASSSTTYVFRPNSKIKRIVYGLYGPDATYSSGDDFTFLKPMAQEYAVAVFWFKNTIFDDEGYLVETAIMMTESGSWRSKSGYTLVLFCV